MAASLWAMPIIVINMGGEMVYILQQRLQAQKVADDKAVKVLQDVVRAMYSPLFITELFKPQEMYTSSSTRQIFEKLAHSSIMRLNKQSMEKLYDLMVMGFKYQIVQCTSPFQILQVSLHHLEIIKSLVKSDAIEKSVQAAINMSLNVYGSLSNSQWLILQQSLLKFLQGKKTKVSLFLQRNAQLLDGTLVLDNAGALPLGIERPGTVRYYMNGSVVNERSMDIPGYEDCVESSDMLDFSSQLGFNMYVPQEQNSSLSAAIFSSIEIANKDLGTRISDGQLNRSMKVADEKGSVRRGDMKSSAKQELNLLADLLGMGVGESDKKSASAAKPFKINLFPDGNFDEKGSKSSNNFINIDIDGTAGAKTFESYLNDLKLVDDEKAGGKDCDPDDLLAMMDSAK